MMNIKSVANPVTSLDSVSSSKAKETVKTFESSDRDANGKQEQADDQPKREFSDEEAQEILNKLKSLPAVVSAGLSVELQQSNVGKKFIVKSPVGEVIKRLTIQDAWISTRMVDSDASKGQLLNKAM